MCTGSEMNSDNYIYEDELCFVYDELNNAQAPTHFVVAPKKTIPRLWDAKPNDEKVLGHLLLIGQKVAMDKGLHMTGYHVMIDESHINNKFIGLHIFGRALHHMVWPMGPGCRL